MIELNASREIEAPVEAVFAAFSDPKRLARWWGPAGFTNTFDTFEFRQGGRWVYTMHGPDGRDYPNESVFSVIEPGAHIMIEHVVKPIYTLTISFAESDGKTKVGWDQRFENEVFATKMRDFLETANGQNLDKLTKEVIGNRDD
jgi:uncharacterized protein YndB with AHSA1/START domain